MYKSNVGEKQLLFDTHKLSLRLGESFNPANTVSLHQGSCVELLAGMPDGVADLIVTSPPYNIGKEYEKNLT